jgi:lipopolysaccharide export system protein LptC
MRPSGASLFPLAIIALLAALSFWLERAVLFGDAAHSGKDRHDPDFIIDNLSMRHFDTQGALQHSGSAAKMVHYGDDDSTEITAPDFTLHKKPSLHITARRGWMSKDGKEVRMENDVRLVRNVDAATPETVLTTQVMVVYPDDDIARSDTAVMVTQGSSVFDGSGFDANSKQQLFSLRGPVHGTFFRNGQQPGLQP